MLLNNIPHEILKSFHEESIFFNKKPEVELIRKLVAEPQALDASEYINMLNFATSKPQQFSEYSNIIRDDSPHCQVFVEQETNDKEPGLMKMSNEFFRYLLQPNTNNQPVSHHMDGFTYYPCTVFTGIADNLNEIRTWIQKVGNHNLEQSSTMLGSSFTQKFIIRVVEEDDLLKFMHLYHVGEWAENIRRSSPRIKIYDFDKRKTISSSAKESYESWDFSSPEYMSVNQNYQDREFLGLYHDHYQKFISEGKPYLFFEIIQILSRPW